MNEHFFLLEDSLNSLQHALLLNKVKILLNQLGKARNCLVQILVPDIVEAQYALSYLLGIAGSPKLGELVHNLLVIVWLDRSTILANTTLIVSDDSSETEYQTLWQLALTLKINLDTRQVASLKLRE